MCPLIRSRRRYTYGIAGILIGTLWVGFALRMLGLGALPLIGDEAYYRLWSEQLAPSYYDHPAGVALMIRASTILAGEGEFGVRWLNAVLGLLTAVVAVAVGRRMLSRRAGAFAGAAVALGAPFLVVARFVYTDVLHLLGVLLNLLAFEGLISEDDRPGDARGVLFGLTLVVLLNTKYSAYLYAAALGGWILLERRDLLRRRAFWIGVGMGVVGLLPVVLWNAAHGWISFRWQLAHFGLGAPGADAPSPVAQVLANAKHAWVYLTPPVFLAGIVGLGRLGRPRERLLTLVALGMLVPVSLSAANSPRNLTTGWVLLILLAGQGWARVRSLPGGRLVAVGLRGGLLIALGVYGVGTVTALSGRFHPVRSSVVPAILHDAVGWRTLGDVFDDWPGSILALDYSLAGQITYYAERQAVTPWGQYLLWGWSVSDPVLVVSREYLPPACATSALREVFREVTDPEVLRVEDRGIVRELRLWRADGRRLPQAELFRQLDFLTLQKACR